jgi:hypothetical protein
MGNTLLTAQRIADEAALQLENNMVMANLVHRGYSTEFQKGRGSTIFIRNPGTFEAKDFSSTVDVQNITESSIAVILDKFKDISVEIGTKELSLDIVDFSVQVLQPIMRAHAQQVDYDILNVVSAGIAGHTTVSGTPALSDLANLMGQLNLQKVPMQDRRVVLSAMTDAKYIALDALANADKRGKSLTIDEAHIGRVLGADFYMDQNVQTHTSGISDTAGAFKGAATAGATAATVDALTDDEVVAAGDVFKVVGSDRGYLVVTGGTVDTNTVTITFTPALDAAVLDDAVVTFQDSHKMNLGFHRNAFALASAPLQPPMGGATYGVATYKGITCRTVMGYNMSTKVNQLSVDILYGVKLLNKELAARLCD